MKIHIDESQESQKNTVQRVQQESSIDKGGEATIVDSRPATAIQRKLRSAMGGVEDTTNPIQRKIRPEPFDSAKETRSRRNKTGLPDNLKSGLENLSGYSMDDVKVHYNSSKPAQLQAYAYAQGTDIHLAPGQQKHLPHEAWHVVQQKQGRVQPTRQLKSKVNINDDAGLEKEADVMGAIATTSVPQKGALKHQKPQNNKGDYLFQLKALDKKIDTQKLNIIGEFHDAYDDFQRYEEKEYVKTMFEDDNYPEPVYWTEDKANYVAEDKTEKKEVFFGDSPSLLFLDRASLLLGIFYEYNTQPNTREKAKEFIVKSICFLEEKRKQIQKYKDSALDSEDFREEVTKLMSILDVLELEMDETGVSAKDTLKTLEEVTRKTEFMVNKYIVRDDLYGPLTPKYVFDNHKTFQNNKNSFSQRRGQHMQRFAQEHGDKFRGVWKVGNAHIKQIKEYEGNRFNRDMYTLIEKASFSKIRLGVKYYARSAFNTVNSFFPPKKRKRPYRI